MKEASCNTLRTRPESNEEDEENKEEKKKKKEHKNVVVPRKIADEQVNKVKVLRTEL
jgi:hypothetical protein